MIEGSMQRMQSFIEGVCEGGDGWERRMERKRHEWDIPLTQMFIEWRYVPGNELMEDPEVKNASSRPAGRQDSFDWFLQNLICTYKISPLTILILESKWILFPTTVVFWWLCVIRGVILTCWFLPLDLDLFTLDSWSLCRCSNLLADLLIS